MKIELIIIVILSILAIMCRNQEKEPDATSANKIAQCQIIGPIEIDTTLASTGDLYGKYILVLSNAVDTLRYSTAPKDTTLYQPSFIQYMRFIKEDSIVWTGSRIDQSYQKSCMIVPGKKYYFHFSTLLLEHLHADSMSFQFRYSKQLNSENQESFEVGLRIE